MEKPDALQTERKTSYDNGDDVYQAENFHDRLYMRQLLHIQMIQSNEKEVLYQQVTHLYIVYNP